MPPSIPSLKELTAEKRRIRDQELGPDAVPPFRLSDVKRRQRHAAPLLLLVLALWIASLFAVIALVRPLMVARSDWYGLLILLYLFLSLGIVSYIWLLIYRWFGLRCPYCSTTFIHIDLKDPKEDPASAAEENRRCGSCQAVIIDLEA